MRNIVFQSCSSLCRPLLLIEVDVAIQEIKTIIDQVSQAIELVLVIILVAGALVLIAGVSSSVDERLHESAILRALGAGRAHVTRRCCHRICRDGRTCRGARYHGFGSRWLGIADSDARVGLPNSMAMASGYHSGVADNW